ncbi:hypothetical protein SAMN04515648_1010 [Phyllobacterium sp. CL33Tsu]|uniref:hypothetical protein n=1 Tax=Phyllobacterium sp. CL33Tsu TaxID=1798191 RepID=UPI0008EB15AF|nr:hypothetical protein [Phyllobacterium sp. CL33Tsu]SFI65548.1 hypothetical protein SAMN04515648_1010 [Phyllobacterium sp. CL33Tsu]
MIDLAKELSTALNPAIFIEVPSSDTATLVAGFGGVLLGGVISWLLGISSQRHARALAAAERTELEKATTIRTMLKIQEITNGYYTNLLYIQNSLRRANADRQLHHPLWQLVKPAIGGPAVHPKFESKDFEMFIRAGRADLIDRATMLSLRYESTALSFQFYSDRRSALQDVLAPHSVVDPSTGMATTVIPPELRALFEMKSQELNDLIRECYKLVRIDFNEALALCEDINLAAKAYFNDPKLFTLTIPSERE